MDSPKPRAHGSASHPDGPDGSARLSRGAGSGQHAGRQFDGHLSANGCGHFQRLGRLERRDWMAKVKVTEKKSG